MSDPKRLPDGTFGPGNTVGFPPGVSGRPGGHAKEHPKLADFADVAMRWLGLVVAGVDGQLSRAAMREALRAAIAVGRSLPDDMPQERVDEEVEALFERWFTEVMMVRSGEKVDVPRMKACIDTVDRYYGKAPVAVNVSGAEGDSVLLQVLRERLQIAREAKAPAKDESTP